MNGSPVGVGWASPTALGTLPLSPGRYLMLLPSPPYGWLHEEVSEPQVHEQNSRMMALAADALYSPQPYEPVEKWLKQQP